MPTLVVEHPRGQQVVHVSGPSSLLDVSDENQLAIPFSCRATTCGSCEATVIEGAELLEKPSKQEQELLAQRGSPPGRRFACAILVRQGSGLVRLRIQANSAGPRITGR